MLKEFFVKLCAQTFTSIIADLSLQEFGWLLRPKGHISILSLRRTNIIVSRVRLVAGLFALLTPFWIAIDFLAFPAGIWRSLALARIAATVGFAAILFSCGG